MGLAAVRIIIDDLADRWQLLVGLRGEIVPDIAGDRVSGQWAAGIRLQQGDRNAHIIGQVIVVGEIRRLDDLAHAVLEFAGLCPLPIAIPTREVSPAGAGSRVGASWWRRGLAR